LEVLRQEINQFTIEAWIETVAEDNVKSSPLSPYMDREIYSGRMWCVDGSKIIREIGFEYKHIGIQKERMQEIIDSYRELGIWPKDEY
jgi:hypothetical protein